MYPIIDNKDCYHCGMPESLVEIKVPGWKAKSYGFEGLVVREVFCRICKKSCGCHVGRVSYQNEKEIYCRVCQSWKCYEVSPPIGAENYCITKHKCLDCDHSFSVETDGQGNIDEITEVEAGICGSEGIGLFNLFWL